MIPTPKQRAFLLLKDTREVLYGGAAGGAKSWALLADAARDVDRYPTKALILRKTFQDLTQPGGLFAVSREWFSGTDASWDGSKYEWRFPSGAVIKFGYLDNEGDHLRYQGGGYHIVAFDELTQLRQSQYIYLFSRIRRDKDFPIKPRARAATNPGGPGHEWVRKRWNLPWGPPHPESIKRKFVQSKVSDNPHLDQEDYMESLEELVVKNEDGSYSDTTYKQLADGDWTATSTGGWFDVDKFKLIQWGDLPDAYTFRNIIRYWDMGGGGPTEENPNPDWTAGVKLGVNYMDTQEKGKPDWYVFDARRIRADAGAANRFIESIAFTDGLGIPQWFEQERGAAGKKEIWYWKNERLGGFMVRGLYSTGTKEARAKTPAEMVNSGRVFLVDGDWDIEGFKAEIGVFNIGDHDDQVDSFSTGFMCLDREQTVQEARQPAHNLGKEGLLKGDSINEAREFIGWA